MHRKLRYISHLMYAANFITIYAIITSGILFWIVFAYIVSKNKKVRLIWKILNCLGTLVAVYIILFYTVLGRMSSDNHMFTFAAEYSNEFYREMLMNAFLYYPFGLTLSAFVGPWSILTGFVLSVLIESWQYFAGTGLAQGTDVIMNTLGCAIGCIPWFVVKADLLGIKVGFAAHQCGKDAGYEQSAIRITRK